MAIGPKRKPTIVLLILLVWVNAVLLYIYRDYLLSPLFWLGYLVFGLFGAFILGSGNPLIDRVSRILAFVVLVVSYLVSLRYPGTLVFTAGFVGLFSGLGLRAMFWDRTKGKWVYCDTCGRRMLTTQSENGVYCIKGHLISPLEPKPAG
jgi:hypothetical protein